MDVDIVSDPEAGRNAVALVTVRNDVYATQPGGPVDPALFQNDIEISCPGDRVLLEFDYKASAAYGSPAISVSLIATRSDNTIGTEVTTTWIGGGQDDITDDKHGGWRTAQMVFDNPWPDADSNVLFFDLKFELLPTRVAGTLGCHVVYPSVMLDEIKLLPQSNKNTIPSTNEPPFSGARPCLALINRVACGYGETNLVTTACVEPTVRPNYRFLRVLEYICLADCLFDSVTEDVPYTAAKPTPCPADLNCDGSVNAQDLTILIAAWGTDQPQADLNSDGSVDGQDMTILIANWGPC